MFKGTLNSGREWLVDAWNGEILVRGENAAGEMEWLSPYWPTLTEAEQDELAAIGTELNDLHLPEKAKAWGKELGVAWLDHVLEDDTLDEWRDMDYEEFHQALVNANAPSFYGSEDQKCAMLEIFGEIAPEDEERCWNMVDPECWLGEIIIDVAYGAAWDACQRYLAEAEEDENA